MICEDDYKIDAKTISELVKIFSFFSEMAESSDIALVDLNLTVPISDEATLRIILDVSTIGWTPPAPSDENEPMKILRLGNYLKANDDWFVDFDKKFGPRFYDMAGRYEH